MLHPALFALSFLSLLSREPETVASLQTLSWPPLESIARWQSPWLQAMNAPDPAADAIVQTYLTTLSEQGFSPDQQGLWLQTGSDAIAAHQGTQALAAASLTKIATTLAALETWPINHRFETLVGHTGTIEQGIVQGDLVIRWQGDPYFVWEEAFAIAQHLQQRGIQEVAGDLVILGPFSMNFESDPQRSGELFKQAVDVQQWSEEIQWIYDTLTVTLPAPTLWIRGQVTVRPPGAAPPDMRWLLRRQSLPLVAILKAMNIYSNNQMADQLAQQMGGMPTVVASVAQQAQIPASEIRLINGSGLGEANQLSPRAVVALLLEMQRQLRSHGLSVADVLPVFGEDEGTLLYRALPRQSALKTGTLNTVSALAGVFPTRDRGLVWFSIQNGGGDLVYLRAQQDALLQQLADHWGQAPPPATLRSQVRLGSPPYQLGDLRRTLPLGS